MRHRSWARRLRPRAQDATRRRNRTSKQLLPDYEQPPLDPAIDEELTSFVARRTAEGGAPAE